MASIRDDRLVAADMRTVIGKSAAVVYPPPNRGFTTLLKIEPNVYEKPVLKL